jgi:putative ABC transport system permease protein
MFVMIKSFSITGELLKEFVKPVLKTGVISTQLAWWAINKWLQDFAYGVKINAGTFLHTTALVLILAVFTIGVQSIKAARSSPIKSLRTE